jgi:hypothetical protein
VSQDVSCVLFDIDSRQRNDEMNEDKTEEDDLKTFYALRDVRDIKLHAVNAQDCASSTSPAKSMPRQLSYRSRSTASSSPISVTRTYGYG